MDPRLLEYYNRELSYLRETGAEFAARHPKVAARLGMQGTDIADPYVERMAASSSALSKTLMRWASTPVTPSLSRQPKR